MNWRIFLLVFLLPVLAFGQDPPVQTIPPGDDKIEVLPKGKEAPYSGQLFDNPTALRWANWLQQYKMRLKADVEREQKVCKARVGYHESLVRIERDRNKEVEKDLRSRLLRAEKARLAAEHEARNPAWYKTRTFGIVVGVVGASAIFGVSVYAVDQLRK